MLYLTGRILNYRFSVRTYYFYYYYYYIYLYYSRSSGFRYFVSRYPL